MTKHVIHQIVSCLCIYLALSSQSLSSQSTEYTIESFQDVYTELSSYQSIGLLTKGDPLWDYEFELEFPFPFYDSSYTRMIYVHDAWGSFTDEEDLAIYLMHYDPFTYENILDTSNISSDVRFSHVVAGDLHAFVIQYTKARFFADPFEDILDTYLNFQFWFYENGVIEVHFGEIQMDNSPIYTPGKGFHTFTTNGGVDTNEVAGPHMGISHPLDEENAIGLSGAYNDYEVVGDIYATLTVLPPEGWIIRFKPTSVATSDLRQYEHIAISPNPTCTSVRLPDIKGRVIMLDATGRTIYSGYPDEDILDVSMLASGLYYLQIISPDKISTGRFVKQ